MSVINTFYITGVILQPLHAHLTLVYTVLVKLRELCILNALVMPDMMAYFVTTT